MNQTLKIIGAREHNLKNVSLEIPKNTLTVFTGVSGSGKSSLAFDTIYAEGQRRYVESLSAYARQFLGVMNKPEVETIEGLSPAISIDQKSTSHNPRSTVGTVTEIYDYLRLLFARIGHPHCPSCGREIESQSPQEITEKVLKLLAEKLSLLGKRPLWVLIFSPVIRGRKGEFDRLLVSLKAKGFTKVRIDGRMFSLSEEIFLLKNNQHTIEVVIDRLSLNKKNFTENFERKNLYSRLFADIEQALILSGGLVIISQVKDAAFSFPEKPKNFLDYLYSQKFACPLCNLSLPEIEPRMFSFNSPQGACPTCSGIGSLLKADPQLVLNPNLSLLEGAVLPFAKLILSDTWFGRIFLTAAKEIGIDPSQPLKKAAPSQLQALLYGTGEKVYAVRGENRFGRLVTIYETFPGILAEVERRFQETTSELMREEIRKYLRSETCPSCEGKRLKKEALSVTIGGQNIAQVASFSISAAFSWVKEITGKLSSREKAIGSLLLKEIAQRLSFLLSVGLDYLTLERSASTLSGGEAQRIRLASQIGSGLSGVLYVLDEPSIGLHPRDNQRLIQTLKKLRDLGNTVIVVEHDREIMENADLIVDFGPGGGKHGGQVVAIGKVSEIKKNPFSLTGQYLSGKKKIQILGQTFEQKPEFLTISGCRENNLKNITVSFPLKRFICVTGVSGSGKSTLVVETLYKALASYFNPFFREKPGKYENLSGQEKLKRVILIDQSPIGRTPRSNPATYTQAFTYIRELFSQLPESRARGYSPSRFSFNVQGGRCEACQGEGEIKIEMQFLPDVYVTCDVCGGTRFNRETLEVCYKGKNIAEVLQMTVEEALSFFAPISGLREKLETLHQVGLSYLQLGQPAPQLSGGEAQRVKLASFLSKTGTRDTLYLLDEPTTGLHFADLEKLLRVLRRLVELGNTVIVIEHNLDVVRNADWIIDLGPEGGEKGGFVVAAGPRTEVAKSQNSYTARYL